MPELSIDKRVNVSLAVTRYQRAIERYNDTVRELVEACDKLRDELGTDQRFVVQSNYRHYLITSDSEANFDVEPIEVI